MHLEDQVTSLELSKKLKEIGVKQESLFYWIRLQGKNENIDFHGLTYIIDIFQEKSKFKEIYSAFTASEISNLLPDKVLFNNQESYLHIQKQDDEYKIFIVSIERIIIFFDKNLANCLAKMLIYLIENKLMEIKKDFPLPLENSPETK